MSLLGSGARFCRTARAMGVVTLVGRVVVEYHTSVALLKEYWTWLDCFPVVGHIEYLFRVLYSVLLIS